LNIIVIGGLYEREYKINKTKATFQVMAQSLTHIYVKNIKTGHRTNVDIRTFKEYYRLKRSNPNE
jgi:hypothetical protein